MSRTVAICNDHRTLLNLSQFVINPSHFVIPVAINLFMKYHAYFGIISMLTK